MVRLTVKKSELGDSSTGYSWPGKLFGVLFGAVFFGVGLLFMVLSAQHASKSVISYLWEAVDVRIDESSVAVDQSLDSPYSVNVFYRYIFNGQEYTSTQYSHTGSGSDDYTEIYYIVEQLKPGSRQTGYVNPRAPQESILVRGSLWLVLLVFFPLPFVIIGALVMYTVLFGSNSPTTETESISEAAKQKSSGTGIAGRVIGAAFFSIFLVVGVLGFYVTFYKPFQQHQSAKTWEQIPAQVIASRVKTHHGDDSTSYSADIFYEYTFANQRFRSNRYSFFSMSTGKYSRVRQIVAQYPEGKTFPVYVDPKNPAEAVITLQLSARSYLGLLTLLFALVGVGGVWAMLRPSKKDELSDGTALVGDPQANRFRRSSARSSAAGEVILEPSTSPVAKLVAFSFFTLFWNGIIAFPVIEAAKSWQQGSPQWILTLAMIPFVLVGGGLIFGVGYSFLCLFNPRPKIYLSSSPNALGDTLALRWELTGRTSNLTRLTLRLVGQEVARYSRGTSTYTDTETFYDQIFVERISSHEIVSGNAGVAIPSDSMHSFSAENNWIRWSIKIEGEIPRWPDVAESFELVIEPKRGL